MGRFSTTVQIKANEDFLTAFGEMMKKRGFEPCSENDAALSYFVALSGGWATLAERGYNNDPKQAHDDALNISKELKTSAFIVEIVDSDFAILKLNGDEVIVGDGSGYGIENPPRGSKNVWEPLLANSTFEELAKIWETNEVFVEDALFRSAPLLGIDPKYIAVDHRDLSENAGNDKNITALFFKKIGAGKPMTLNAGFIKVFGEGLEPLGFRRLKKIKNKQPYYARVINGEILQAITYRTVTSSKLKYKCVQILGGAVTLYRRNLDFLYHTLNPQDELPDIRRYLAAYPELEFNETVMKSVVQYNCDIWGSPNDLGENKDTLEAGFRRAIIDFHIKSDDNEEMLKGLELAFDVLKSVTLPVLDKLTDLDHCIDFFHRTESWMDLCPFDEFVADERYGYSQGLVLVKAGYGGKELRAFEDKKQAEEERLMKAGYRKYTQEEFDEWCRKRDELVAKETLLLEELSNDSRVFDELERVRAVNAEILRSYGLEI